MPTLHTNQFTVTLDTPRSLYPCGVNWCLNCGESLEVSTNLSDGRPARSQNTSGPLSARLLHFTCTRKCSSNLEIVSHCEFPTRSHNIEISCWERYVSYSFSLKLESENCCMHINTELLYAHQYSAAPCSEIWNKADQCFSIGGTRLQDILFRMNST